MILPIPLLISFLTGLLSLALLIAGPVILYRAWRRYQTIRNSIRFQPRVVRDTPAHTPAGTQTTTERPPTRAEVLSDRSVWLPLAIGLALLLFTFAGRHLVHLAIPTGSDEPRDLKADAVYSLQRPDGTKIHVEVFGPSDAPTLVFTHGWSTSVTEWYYAKRDLGGRYRLIFWDLPGLGQSTQPESRDYSLDKMASDLEAVLTYANGKPVVLVGHSIGGMINLTFCRLFPNKLGHGVSGIVQVDTSYTNPVTTTQNAALSRILQKPVGEPILHAMIWFSPVVRVMSWLGYQNGTSQIMNAKSAFAGSETWGQVDLISRYGFESTPSVVARGTLAMFHWDATPVLPSIHVPVLILVGQQDTTTLPSASEYMQQKIPNANLQSVSPSAHYGLLEQNQRYNSAISNFALACLKAGSS